MSALSALPQDRMGVYKDLREVPSHHRLEHHESAYEHKDPWQEYLDDYLVPPRNSKSKRQQCNRSFRYWVSFMDDRGQHYALATPSDVEAWSKQLLDEYAPGYAYTNWAQIERFYTWMQMHPEHSHVYQPFWMAAADLESASHELWAIKVTRHWEVQD